MPLHQLVDMRQRHHDRRLAPVRTLGEVRADAGDGREVDRVAGLVCIDGPQDEIALAGLGEELPLLLGAWRRGAGCRSTMAPVEAGELHLIRLEVARASRRIDHGAHVREAR